MCFTPLHSLSPCDYILLFTSLMRPHGLLVKCPYCLYIGGLATLLWSDFCSSNIHFLSLFYSFSSRLATLSLCARIIIVPVLDLSIVVQSTLWQAFNKEVLCLHRTFILVGIVFLLLCIELVAHSHCCD
jgi:hypothetical protein